MRNKAKKVLKPLCAALTLCSCLLFFAFWYLSANIPESILYTDSADMVVSGIFPVKAVYSGDIRNVQGASDQIGTEYEANMKLFGIFPVTKTTVKKVPTYTVGVLGNPFGIKLYADGVMVVGMSDVDAKSGKISPAENAGIEVGDIIVSVAGITVSSNNEVAAVVSANKDKTISVVIKRNGVRKTVEVTPAYSESEKCYRIGLFVRDSSAGIGTLTFYDPKSNTVAGLGHGITDRTTGEIIPLLSGEMVGAEILGVEKSEVGNPGELKGRFTLTKVGDLLENSGVGVYGTTKSVYATDRLYPVAMKQEIKTGEAKIYTTISGAMPQFYDCRIDKIYLSDKQSQSMVITITDETLLKTTGGIVQGMSGSPIIQDGKLVGAVTHVFINNPEKGYAIFAENMLETARSVNEQKKAG